MPPPVSLAASKGDRSDTKPKAAPAVVRQSQPPIRTAASEYNPKDAIISWFRSEFAAANAVIDALCNHLTEREGGQPVAYESAFAAIHRRRLNWIPMLQMQKYYSIADVAAELKKVTENMRSSEEVDVKEIEELANDGCDEVIDEKEKPEDSYQESSLVSNENGGGEVADEDLSSEITETGNVGSQEVKPFSEHDEICSNHDHCEARRAQIKMTKGFVAKEPVKGHMVNVVRGLKLYEDVFTDTQLSKLNEFVKELRVAGQNGELSGETFILYNQQTKGNKRELIQLGVPIFGQVKEDNSNAAQRSNNEPIPPLLQGVIDHLIQWRLLPENRKPNSCIINFFDEGEYSQPFLKPPHLEQPLSTLLLSESKMAFGRVLVSDGEGNYKGPLMLYPKEGSVLVMRGNSSDTARHVMCSSPNKRISITFFRVRAHRESNASEISTSYKGITLRQPSVVTPHSLLNSYSSTPVNMIPKWGLLRAPVIMLAAAPMRPVIVNQPRKIPRGGTGVFLPWNVGSRRHAKHLPPRAQRGRLLALPSPADANKAETLA